ncbi:MAG: hypothetical protein BWY80_00236 [Firmicutes bacterium ADurb.Bin456]|nr:MAG: hypothetical protein BWY80_00236 [Firmicutes bacterium ADurb.Bin456]
MNAALQTKTDQAIRALTPEQLAEYAVNEKWVDRKALWEKRITEQDAEDHANIFSKKFLNPMSPRDYQLFKTKYDRLNMAEETRTAFSVTVGLVSDQIVFTQALLTAIDRLMDVAYKVRDGKEPWPEDLEWTISFSEKVIPPSLMRLETRKAELKEYLEFMADLVTLPPDQELVPTPQEVRDYMEKKQAGEEYQDDIVGPFLMPSMYVAKCLGVETEGRPYGEVANQVRTALYNADHWDEDQGGEE